MPDMLFDLNIFNAKKKAVDRTTINLNGKPDGNYGGALINTWSIRDLNSPAAGWSWGTNALFDNGSWDVTWLRVKDHRMAVWHLNYIICNSPTSRHDQSHQTGGGRIHETKNPDSNGSRFDWKVKCLAGCHID
ncbi:MAG: hypothetical protein R2747_08105 [Pyrinomonadaceae bacterium]